MENVFLSLSHGFQVRNFIQTPFIAALVKAYHVVIIIEEADKHYLEKFLERLQISNVEVVGIKVDVNKHEDLFLLLRKNIFVSPKRAQTKNILNEMNSSTLGAWQKPLSVANRI